MTIEEKFLMTKLFGVIEEHLKSSLAYEEMIPFIEPDSINMETILESLENVFINLLESESKLVSEYIKLRKDLLLNNKILEDELTNICSELVKTLKNGRVSEKEMSALLTGVQAGYTHAINKINIKNDNMLQR